MGWEIFFHQQTCYDYNANTAVFDDIGDFNGKLLKLTYGNGDYEEYIYDNLDRLVSVKFNGTVEYTLIYDANGRLYSMTEGTTTHVYEYDSLDRLIRAYQKDANGIIVAVENTYDELGRAKGSSYVLGDKEMEYTLNYKQDSNLVDYISMPTVGTQSMIRYYYDEFDRVIEKFIAHSTTMNYSEEYEYYTYTDSKGITHTTSLVSQITFSSNNFGTADVVYDYTYDNLGNITAVYKNGALAESYEYDSLGQLTRADNVAADSTVFYQYDKAGNILYKFEFAYTSESTSSIALALANNIISYQYTTGAWGDMLTRFGYNGTTVNYDAIGNPTNWRNSSVMSWSARELASQTLSDGTTLTYTYNSSGIRTRKVYNDSANSTSYIHNYLLDGTKILKETVTIVAIGGGTTYDLHYVYDESGNVVGLHYNNQPYYFQKNLQGDVIRILDYSGDVVVEYTYDAWGKVLSVTGSLANTLGQRNPFRYRSYYYDTETGFYYLQSRYYDPVVGRFINEDRFVATSQGFSGSNMFAYCGNNPVTRKDDSGEFWLLVACVAVICPLVFTSCGDPNESLVGTPADPAPKTTRYATEKEAVDAAFAAVAAEYKKELNKGNNFEHICAIYEYEGGYYLHTVQTSDKWEKVEVSKDRDVVAEVHTHPHGKGNIFSAKDLSVAKDWQRDSYVLVVGEVNDHNHDKFYLSYKASNCGQYTKYYTAGEISDESEMRVPRIWRYWIHETC